MHKLKEQNHEIRWLIYSIRLGVLLYILLTYFVFNFHYKFMVLNLSLAYIPLEIALLMRFSNWKSNYFIGLFLLWLLFYPNAPYILTDAFHVEQLNIYRAYQPFRLYLPSWNAFVHLQIGIFYGFTCGLTSLFIVQKTLEHRKILTARYHIFMFHVIVALLTGYGIYLGRFPRLHTVYILTEPLTVIKILISTLTKETLYFSLSMAILQLALVGICSIFVFLGYRIFTWNTESS